MRRKTIIINKGLVWVIVLIFVGLVYTAVFFIPKFARSKATQFA